MKIYVKMHVNCLYNIQYISINSIFIYTFYNSIKYFFVYTVLSLQILTKKQEEKNSIQYIGKKNPTVPSFFSFEKKNQRNFIISITIKHDFLSLFS